MYSTVRTWFLGEPPIETEVDVQNSIHLPPAEPHTKDTKARLRPQEERTKDVDIVMSEPHAPIELLLQSHLEHWRSVKGWFKAQRQLNVMRFEKRLQSLCPSQSSELRIPDNRSELPHAAVRIAPTHIPSTYAEDLHGIVPRTPTRGDDASGVNISQSPTAHSFPFGLGTGDYPYSPANFADHHHNILGQDSPGTGVLGHKISDEYLPEPGVRFTIERKRDLAGADGSSESSPEKKKRRKGMYSEDR
eukprot:Rmarinus@m.30098